MIYTNPVVKQMTPFIVMEVLEKASEMEKQGIHIIHLEVGEPDFDLPLSVSDGMKSAVSNGHSHYTHSLGLPELRQEIASMYKREYSVDVDPGCVVITSGSSPAILLALMTICGQDSEVILTNPGYPCYKNFVLACQSNPKFVKVSAENGFKYNPDDLKKVITPQTRAIVVNSPMNPAGTLLDESDFIELAKLSIPIISDEIYHGLVYEGKAHSVLEFTNNAFVINGFSKRFAMTGLRLGYLIAPKEYIRPIQILQQNLFICAPSVAQHAAIEAIRSAGDDVERMKAVYDERRIYMLDRLRKMGFVIKAEPKGAFYILADAKKFTKDSYKFCFDLLEKAHVGITPGVDFGSNGEGFVRFSYANSIDNLKEGLNRVEKYLAEMPEKP